MNELAQAELNKLLEYNPETGLFTRRVSVGRGAIGSVAGYIDDEGYRRICIDGRTYMASRLAFLWMTGDMPPIMADHENRQRSDDRWKNLRLANHVQNGGNRGRQKNKSSNLPKGVFPRYGKFRAIIRDRHLGSFDTVEEATLAYEYAAKELFGQFALVI